MLKPVLDRAFEDKEISEILSASPAALAGVSESDAEALRKVFGVKTIAELATCKPFLAAQAILTLAGKPTKV